MQQRYKVNNTLLRPLICFIIWTHYAFISGTALPDTNASNQQGLLLDTTFIYAGKKLLR